MPVKIDCPNPACGASAVVSDARLGRDARCTRCGQRFALIPGTRAGSSASRPSFGPPVDLGPAEEASLPASFGRFRVVRELGRGGMGAVYLAQDAELGRLVALKVPHPAYREAPDVRERLIREARAAAQFRHPNFCPIYDIGEVDGVPYLGMSYIEGRTLASAIEPGRPWPQRKAAEVVRRLALALAEAHRRGVVHRDLKPANIMVDHRGKLVLMDFGLALRLDGDDPRLTRTGAIVGTPAYMPPEQVEGDPRAVGPRSDIYSLGVILYELLTGRRPFEGSAAMVLGLVLVAEIPPPSGLRPDLDPRLESICLKAMARRPGDRHASMDAFAEALRAWMDAPRRVSETAQFWSILAVGPSRVRLAPHRRPAPTISLAAASVLAVGIASTAWMIGRPAARGPSSEAGRVAAVPSRPEPTRPPQRSAKPTPDPEVATPKPAPELPATLPVASVVVPEPEASVTDDSPKTKPARPASTARKPRRRAPAVRPDEPTIILVPVEVPVPVGGYLFPGPPPRPGGPPPIPPY